MCWLTGTLFLIQQAIDKYKFVLKFTWLTTISNLLPPANEGNVFAGVCLSTVGVGGVCLQEGRSVFRGVWGGLPGGGVGPDF